MKIPERLGRSKEAVQIVHSFVERHDDRLIDPLATASSARSGHVDQLGARAGHHLRTADGPRCRFNHLNKHNVVVC